jgi:hypothetical protein
MWAESHGFINFVAAFWTIWHITHSVLFYLL